MDFNKADILEWEITLYEKNYARMYGIKNENECLKRRNPERRINKNIPTFWWVKETKRARVMYQKAFRRKMKQNIDEEIGCNIRPRDYKTYGWLTW